MAGGSCKQGQHQDQTGTYHCCQGQGRMIAAAGKAKVADIAGSDAEYGAL
jgi:hypothetical protein